MVLNLQIYLIIKIKADQRRKNLSTTDKVVIIIPYKAEVMSYWDIIFAEWIKDNIL